MMLLSYSGVMKNTRVTELDSLEKFLQSKGQLHNGVVQGLDLTEIDIDWQKLNFHGAVFLGCSFPKDVTAELLAEKGALVFPKLPDLPYSPYRNTLYTREELMEGWSHKLDASVDKKIYDHFVKFGKSNANVLESLSQRVHDHAVDDALKSLLNGSLDGSVKKVVGIMGGHGTSRNDPFYKKVVYVARDLTEEGYFVASGGGPGIMEAANLGAWLAGVADSEVEQVLAVLAQAPYYTDENYIASAQQVLRMYPNGAASLAVPTWFYGHEPSNLFSPYIAKYFSNSIREDGLLAIATHGVVFAPGSAGTTQEIFMDATQNHYVTFDKISPMVFFSKKRYTQDTMLYPCINELSQGREYNDYITCVDEVTEVIDFIKAHPPR